jgi:hypothetical protein
VFNLLQLNVGVVVAPVVVLQQTNKVVAEVQVDNLQLNLISLMDLHKNL